MVNTVVLFSADGKKVETYTEVQEIVMHDSYIKIRYIDGKIERTISTNLPFIYYDGEKEVAKRGVK
jgi:hypothetical protein